MPLTQDQEEVEHRAKLRNMEADTMLKIEQAKWEPWKVVISAGASGAALMAAAVALAAWVLPHLK